MSIRGRLLAAGLAGLLALTAAACGDRTDASTPAHATDEDTVRVADMAYAPATVTVKAGTTVTWMFDDGAISHDVVGEDFHSDVMASGTFTHRFDEPGTYDYLCSLHPSMTGTVEVTE